jgi:hypothetical protein
MDLNQFAQTHSQILISQDLQGQVRRWGDKRAKLWSHPALSRHDMQEPAVGASLAKRMNLGGPIRPRLKRDCLLVRAWSCKCCDGNQMCAKWAMGCAAGVGRSLPADLRELALLLGLWKLSSFLIFLT